MKMALAALIAAIPMVAQAKPPPEGSPDWILVHNDKDQIEKAYSVGYNHCCGYADGRPLNDYDIRFDTKTSHYFVRYNKKRWTEGTVSQAPPEPEPGDVWLEVVPGMLTFDYQPMAFTMAWIGEWMDYGPGGSTDHQSLYCVSVKGGV